MLKMIIRPGSPKTIDGREAHIYHLGVAVVSFTEIPQWSGSQYRTTEPFFVLKSPFDEYAQRDSLLDLLTREDSRPVPEKFRGCTFDQIMLLLDKL